MRLKHEQAGQAAHPVEIGNSLFCTLRHQCCGASVSPATLGAQPLRVPSPFNPSEAAELPLFVTLMTSLPRRMHRRKSPLLRVNGYFTGKQSRSLANATGPKYLLLISD